MFAVHELLKATNARLILGKGDTTVKGISIDTRTIRPGEAFIAIKGHNFDGHNFIAEAIQKGARAAIIHHPLSTIHYPKNISFLLVKDTTKALGDIARFQRKKFNIPVIAVTGSNGKTTAKEMIAWVFSRKFKVLKNEGTKNNQIGLPMALLNLDTSHKVAVLELGTNHPGEIGYLAGIACPNIAIITNIGPAHLEYFRSLKGVLKEKTKLLRSLENPRIAILNADDGFLKNLIIKKVKRPIILGVGIKQKSDFCASRIKSLNGKIEFLVNKKNRFTLRTLGYYNIYNALTAIAAARIFGMPYKDIARALTVFNFPCSRLQPRVLHNVNFIDDTYNANPASLKQALEALAHFPAKGKRIFVMGDMLELGGKEEFFHREAGRMAAGACDAFIAAGRFSGIAGQAARVAGLNIKNIFTCENSAEARDILFNRMPLSKDDIVLVKGSRAMKMEEVFKI